MNSSNMQPFEAGMLAWEGLRLRIHHIRNSYQCTVAIFMMCVVQPHSCVLCKCGFRYVVSVHRRLRWQLKQACMRAPCLSYLQVSAAHQAFSVLVACLSHRAFVHIGMWALLHVKTQP